MTDLDRSLCDALRGRRCAFLTLGCKVNQYDTQAIRERLLACGAVEVSPDAPADAFIVNSCSVTATSDSKSRRAARHAARISPGALVVVTGCTADSDPRLAAKLGIPPAGLLVVGNDRKLDIPRLLAGRWGGAAGPGDRTVANTWSAGISSFEGHTRAFIKIQDGCNNFCSYCIVPHVRGRVRSRPVCEIVNEARRLADRGYREIVLTGIHAGAWGQDGCSGELADVIEALRGVEGLQRLRLSSIEAVEVSDRLIELAAAGALCPHFHVPLQSGSDAVLERMNRRYTASQFLDLVERLRERIPQPSITTDVLLGFPGETDADFERTAEACLRAGFSRTHIFPFSARPGTPAARLPGRCSPQAVAERKRRLAAIAWQTALDYKNLFAGRHAAVLVEGERDRSGKLCGYTDRYIRVLFDGPDSLMGRLAAVRLGRARPEAMLGTLADEARA